LRNGRRRRRRRRGRGRGREKMLDKANNPLLRLLTTPSSYAPPAEIVIPPTVSVAVRAAVRTAVRTAVLPLYIGGTSLGCDEKDGLGRR
jgi:hypothetical protein